MRMDDVFDRFVKERVPRYKGRSRIEYPRTINGVLKEYFGKRQIKDITPSDLKSFMDVEKGLTNRNRQLSVLASVCEAAIKWGYIDFNPCKGVERHKQRKRDRIVTDREVDGFIAKTGPDKAASLAISLARYTGLKQGAIINLTWEQVYENEGVIRTLSTKTNKAVQTELTPEARQVLERCKQPNGKLKLRHRSKLVCRPISPWHIYCDRSPVSFRGEIPKCHAADRKLS